MTKENRQLLCCLRTYRLGETTAEIIEPLSPEEWRRLYSLATVHKLVPVVYETLHAAPGFCNSETVLCAVWKRETILQAMGQTGRTQKLLELTRALEDAGVCYAVVKGAVCRQLYSKPDLRLSGDEDLFIPYEERARCGEIFTQHGLTAVLPQEWDDVDHWQDPCTGLHIELHTRLFSLGWTAEEVLNSYFAEQLVHTVSTGVDQSAVRTLEPTAHLLFLIAHALKHFITGGFGVRTWADTLSFCEQYRDQIDKEFLWEMLNRIHGTIFFQKLLLIGQTYLAFDVAPWGDISSDQSDGNDLLEDMLAAGIYGQTSIDRKHGGALALQAARGKQKKPSLRAALFPPASNLEGRYPILRKAPVLLPALWIHRIGRYGLEVLKSRGEESLPWETVSLGKQRTEMMVKYGILPQAKTKDC